MIQTTIGSNAQQEVFAQQQIAPQIKIETKIFRGNDTKASGANITLFDNSLVYDFMFEKPGDEKPIEVVIFDPNRSRFIMLNPRTNSRTELELLDIYKLIEDMKTQRQLDAEREFLINIEFDETTFADGVLTLRSKKLTYKTSGQKPKDETHFNLIMRYMDEYARLNATQPRALPPFARLELNSQIRAYNFVPNVVEVNLNLGGQEIVLKTKHQIEWHLQEKDQELINYAKKLLLNSERVNFAQFRELNLK